MKFLPINISTFSTIITGNYIYVDKTQYIYDLYSTGNRYHFLSRPRQFGKTLLVSTLKELFSNNRNLFEGLWISTSNYQWVEYPIVHIDFTRIAHRTSEQLEQDLVRYLSAIAEQYGLAISSDIPESLLDQIVVGLAQRNKVVVLIDEYDYPLLSHLHDIKVAKKIQTILKSLYGVLKGLDPYLHAVFMTGVSKFAKTSIFSGINNLIDITLTHESAHLLGYTKREIEHYFKPYITHAAHENNKLNQSIIEDITRWYDGYRFSENIQEKVYSPYSVLNYLKDKKLKNYWFSSGTPSFLIHLLKTQYYTLQNIEDIELSSDSLGTFEIDNIPLIALLFQTGYLTIVDYDQTNNTFKLNYPNKEVSESFKKYIVRILANANVQTVETTVQHMITSLKDNDIDTFCLSLQSLFANIPYHLHIEQERYFHSLFQFLGSLLGLTIQSEVATDKGRADLVITTQTHIYIFELKFKIDAETALQQIEELRYYERYIIGQKSIILVGLAFNYRDKKLTLDWRTKYLENTACHSISKSHS
jgi:Predicted AAA-ATPase/PD-(D/E)XK nuclease superfamily